MEALAGDPYPVNKDEGNPASDLKVKQKKAPLYMPDDYDMN